MTLLLIGGFLLIVVGAIAGLIAAARTRDHRERLDRLHLELRDLRRELLELRGARAPGQASSPQPSSSPAPSTPRPSPPAATADEPMIYVPEPAPPPRVTARELAESLRDLPPVPPPRTSEPAFTPPAGQPEEGPLPSRAAASRAAASHTSGPSFAGVEQALGLRWLTWIGTALLFLGIAFFLKYAYDRDWLGRLFGPRLRIATATGVALALATLGWRSLRTGMVALGQGMLGGGQALLYLTIYAALEPAVMVVDAPLLGPTAAFALMTFVTAAGLLLAVRLEAIAMAFLAVLGGFATPLLIHGDGDTRDLLFTYLLVLDLGVLAVAARRRWRALDLLAFAGTGTLFAAWWNAHGSAHPQPDATLAWVLAFHLVFAVLPFVQHWRQRTAVTLERFVLALVNVATTFAFLGSTLRETAPRLLAATCLSAAVVYAALGLVTAHRVGDDRRTRDGFLALATLLLTLGMFWLLPGDVIATAWYAEAAALAWLAARYVHPSTASWAMVVLAVALGRTLLHHLPGIDRSLPFAWNAWFANLAVAGLGLAAFGVVYARRTSDAAATTSARRGVAQGFGIAAGCWLLAAGSGEILRHAAGHPDDWRAIQPLVAVAWLQLLGSLAFVAWAWRWPARSIALASLLPIFAATIAVGFAYDRYPPDALPVLNAPCLAGLGVLGALATSALTSGRNGMRSGASAGHREALLGFVQLAATTLATVEALAWMQRGDARPGAAALTQVLGWIWLGAGTLGAFAAAAWSNRRVLALAAVPLALATIVPVSMFADALVGVRETFRIVANQRCLFAVLVTVVVASLRHPLLRLSSRAAADAVAVVAFTLLMLYSTCEVVAYGVLSRPGTSLASWLPNTLGTVALLGSVGAAARHRATGNAGLRLGALAMLCCALALSLLAYGGAFRTPWMFANGRAGLVAIAVTVAMRTAGRDAGRQWLRWLATAVALLGLTLEPPSWILDHVPDRAEAARLASFSITVTWVVTAGVLLHRGFVRDERPLRLIALGLFTLTAGKLLAFDLSGEQQLYRILAFVLVGIAFVAASWLYHRVERRLRAARATNAAGTSGGTI